MHKNCLIRINLIYKDSSKNQTYFRNLLGDSFLAYAQKLKNNKRYKKVVIDPIRKNIDCYVVA